MHGHNKDGLSFDKICKSAVQCRDCFKDQYLKVKASYIDIAQPRYIGVNYFTAHPRILVLMINPAKGVDPATLNLLREYSSGKLNLVDLFEHQADAMRYWNKDFEGFYFHKIGLIKEETAFANVAWCSTEDNKYPSRMLERCFRKHTKPLIDSLKPDLILLSGSTTYKFDRFKDIQTIKTLHYAHRKGHHAENAEMSRIREVINKYLEHYVGNRNRT